MPEKLKRFDQNNFLGRFEGLSLLGSLVLLVGCWQYNHKVHIYVYDAFPCSTIFTRITTYFHKVSSLSLDLLFMRHILVGQVKRQKNNPLLSKLSAFIYLSQILQQPLFQKCHTTELDGVT